MGTVVKPNTFTANTTAVASEVNDNFDTIYNEFNGNISAANLATGAVTTAKIADSNVTTAKIADSNITTAKIADSNVTTAKIADSNVTNAKLSTSAGEIGAAWVSYTPTVTANSGSFTSASATGKYTKIGRSVFFNVAVTITTVGTGAGVQFTLPFTAQTTTDTIGGYRESTGGLTGTVRMSTSTVAIIHEYDNSQTLATGHVFRCYGFYEASS